MGEKHGDIYTYNPSNMMIWDNVCVCTNRYTTVYPLVYPTISCCNLIPGNMIRLNQGMEWGILCCQFPSRHRKKKKKHDVTGPTYYIIICLLKNKKQVLMKHDSHG